MDLWYSLIFNNQHNNNIAVIQNFNNFHLVDCLLVDNLSALEN